MISTFTLFLTAFYFWVAENATTVRFPDSGTPIELYSTEMQDDLGLAMKAAINEAKNSVTLMIYAMTDHRIIDALNKKAEEGVRIKVVCDANASRRIEEKLNPQIALTKRFLSGLMHLKVLVIDEKQTWIGSANMTGESLRHHSNLVAAIDSQPVAATAIAKADSLTAYERTKLFPHTTYSVGGQKMELWFLPDNTGGVAHLKSLIQAAKKTIRVAMFTWTRNDLAMEIIKARDRGVAVEIVIDKGSSVGASAKIVKLLKKNDLAVKVNNTAALLHNKCLYIDDNILVNGSANWTQAAFNSNDDCFMVLYDLTQTQTTFLNNMWKVIIAESMPAR